MTDTRIRQSSKCPDIFFIETDDGRQMVEIFAYASQGYDEWHDVLLTLYSEKDSLKLPAPILASFLQKLFQVWLDRKFGPGQVGVTVGCGRENPDE